MKKVYLFGLLWFFMSCFSTNEGINKELLDSVCEIHVQNRTPKSFGGIEEYRIKDKREISLICKELLALKNENNLQTRPYDGTIVIEFMRRDKDGTDEYISVLSTRIILKPNSQYFITNSRGQYTSDSFLAKIIKYLQIDES